MPDRTTRSGPGATTPFSTFTYGWDTFRVVSVAYKFGGTNEASRGARRAVYDAFGSDFLEHHRVTRRNPGLLADANLILVMEKELQEDLPPEKTYGFNEFLGSGGDVENPWPDREDDAAHLRYRNCMRQIRSTVESGIDRILSYLDEQSTTV